MNILKALKFRIGCLLMLEPAGQEEVKEGTICNGEPSMGLTKGT